MAESGQELSYGQLEERSRRAARMLYEAGLRTGDVVAMLCDNRPESYEIYWTALRSGLFITAINHNLAPEEVDYIVRDCGATALFVSDNKRGTAAQLDIPVSLRYVFGAGLAGYRFYEQAIAEATPEPLEQQPHGDDFLYSSGTTGRPKGIKRGLPDLTFGEAGYSYPNLFAPLYGFDESSVYLSPAPVYHAAPLRFGGVVHATGGTLVMMDHFDPENFLTAVQTYRVTHTQMVPTMFVRLLKLPEEVRRRYDLSSLKVVVHAAAPCPIEVKKQMIDWFGPIIHEYYAATEANGVTIIDSETWLTKPGSVGTAILGTPHICGEDGAEVPVGQVGTVYFEQDADPFEYHNDADRTSETRHRDHPSWTTVGDIGYLDDDGYLFLTDRRAFTIISGGVNIYPQELENLYALHPSPADIAVIGVPDDEMGERVVAFVEPADGVEPGPELQTTLTEYARNKIASFKVPREFHFQSELPRTPTGKMVREFRRSSTRGPPQARPEPHASPAGPPGFDRSRAGAQPNQSSTAAAVQDCCILPSASPVSGS